mmetsp:Transcript_26160/g.34779  ORF Transcript_26160/g.34779 Transcript_26160/m.34779 type:complete len:1284 (+) Transcript_26160:209-4060(+)
MDTKQQQQQQQSNGGKKQKRPRRTTTTTVNSSMTTTTKRLWSPSTPNSTKASSSTLQQGNNIDCAEKQPTTTTSNNLLQPKPTTSSSFGKKIIQRPSTTTKHGASSDSSGNHRHHHTNNSHNSRRQFIKRGHHATTTSNNTATINTTTTTAKHFKSLNGGQNNKANKRACQSQTSSTTTFVHAGKKNRASISTTPFSQHHHHHHHPPLFSTQAPKPFNPIGKTGVSALHELCDKQHWNTPSFFEMDDTSPPLSTPREFVIVAVVNQREFGRGRGGTKASARQDAARRALSSLLPGVAFDANGIVIHVPTTAAAAAAGNTTASNVSSSSTNQSHDGKNTALEELAPNLAERLAIHGRGCGKDDNDDDDDDEEQEEKNGKHDKGDVTTIGGTNRPLSPSPSEDSSISTAFSIGGGTGTTATNAVITGGPIRKHSLVLLPSSSPTQQQQYTPTFHHMKQQHSSSNKTTSSMQQMNIYPCASTTSGVSSENDGLDEDDDDDAYYASRGASVCSALLHAMWQIDDRIKEPPSYAFDVCPLPASPTSAAVPTIAMSPSSMASNSNRRNINKSSSKRKGGGLFSGGKNGAMSSKRISVTTAVGTTVTVHRSSFACTASLFLHTLCEEKEEEEDTVDGSSTNEGKMKKKNEKEGEAISSKTLIVDITKNDKVVSIGGGDESNDATKAKVSEKLDKNNKNVIKEKNEKRRRQCEKIDGKMYHVKQLEAVGTGATKREARHVASAKLLALLFPSCRGMVEVKAAAEAARERYAASKAKSRQSKRALSLSSGGGAGGMKKENRRRKGGQGCATAEDGCHQLGGDNTDCGRGVNTDYSVGISSYFTSFAQPLKQDPLFPTEEAARISLLLGMDDHRHHSGCRSCNRVEENTITASGNNNIHDNESNNNSFSHHPLTVDGIVSVAGLSLSESIVESPSSPSRGKEQQAKRQNSTCPQPDPIDDGPSLRQIARQKQLEESVDSALQALQDVGDEELKRLSPSFRNASIDDDVGKTILRRAGPNDGTWVQNLLSKDHDILRKKGTASEQESKSTTDPLLSCIGPLSLIGLSSERPTISNAALNDATTSGAEDLTRMSSLLWGGVSFTLLLSRAVPAYDEPPLGCAVLTLSFSLSAGRLLRISCIAHEEHLPRERFIECLEGFAAKMSCELDINDGTGKRMEKARNPPDIRLIPNNDSSRTTELSRQEMENLVRQYVCDKTMEHDSSPLQIATKWSPCIPEDSSTPETLRNSETPLSNHLQSVKEEESEEYKTDDDGEDDEALESVGTKNKPSKRTRVA